MKRLLSVVSGLLLLWALAPAAAFAAPAAPRAHHTIATTTAPARPAAKAPIAGPRAAQPRQAPSATGPAPQPGAIFYPSRPQWLQQHPSGAPSVQGVGDLAYYRGITLESPTIYVIFWGSSWDNGSGGVTADGQVMDNYFSNVGSSSFTNILTQYYDTHVNISSSVSYFGYWIDHTAPPTDTACSLNSTPQPTVEDSSIQAEVSHAISVNGWPTDSNGIYFVYTPSGDEVHGFSQCSFTGSSHPFCGYHSYSGAYGSGVAYAAMPYPNLTYCPAVQSPNGNKYGDSLASVSSHEQFEATTDPFPDGIGGANYTGWTDSVDAEIGDKCAWDFNAGNTYLGSYTFYIQTEYSNSTHSCVNTFTGPPAPPANDDFNSAISVSHLPYANTQDTQSATTAVDDPSAQACFTGDGHDSESVWYKLTLASQTGLRINTLGSNFDTVIGVWIGSRGSLQQVACDDDHYGGLQSYIGINAPPGTYYIELSSYSVTPGGILDLAMTSGPVVTTTTGVFRPSNGNLYLKNSNTSGFADTAITYGLPGDLPVVGDWTGKGYDTIGVFRPSTGQFLLRNSNTTGPADIVSTFGKPGDIPVAGTWAGSYLNIADGIGVYRPSNNTFYLSYNATNPTADLVIPFGAPGDLPVVGAWGGEDEDSIGVYRPSTGTFYLSVSPYFPNADIIVTFGPPHSKPIAGDWTGTGYDSIGVDSGGTFYLRYTNSTGFADAVFNLGLSTDTPIAGWWNPLPGAPPPAHGHGTAKPAPRQPSTRTSGPALHPVTATDSASAEVPRRR